MTNTNQQEQLYRWVKASESLDRLPMEKFMPLLDNVGHNRLGNFFKDEDDRIGCSIIGTEMYGTYTFYQLHQISWLEPYTPPVEDGKQGGEVSVEDVLADIILIRNKLHEDLPTGEMNAFELLQTIKWHINELDNYCTTLSTYKSQPSTPVQDGWVAIRDRLPDQAACIFAYKFGVAEGKYFMGRFLKTDLETVFPEVTHWQTLPSPPVNKQD